MTATETDTIKLASGLASNVDEAFPAFVAEFETMAYSIALRFVGRHDEAVDLAAEAFHRAYKALHDYSSTQIEQLKLRPWLVTIVLNLCRNAVRSASRRPREIELDDSVIVTSHSLSPEQSVIQQDSRQRLEKWLLRLSDQQRAAVVLHYVVGLSYEEIAVVLSCPASTARSHAARGLTQLRKFIGPEKESV